MSDAFQLRRINAQLRRIQRLLADIHRRLDAAAAAADAPPEAGREDGPTNPLDTTPRGPRLSDVGRRPPPTDTED